MALAGHHGEGLLGLQAHTDRLRAAIGLLAPGTETGATVVAAAAHRHADQTEQHPAILDQGHVDGELLATGDELLGAVQRVHQPPAPPVAALAQRYLAILFGKHRNVRRQRPQPRLQYMVRGQVGGGNRRFVGLRAHRHVGAPVRQDRLAGAPHQRHQFAPGHRPHAWYSPRWVSRSRTRYSAARARPSLNWACWARLDSSRRLMRSTPIGSGSSPGRRSS